MGGISVLYGQWLLGWDALALGKECERRIVVEFTSGQLTGMEACSGFYEGVASSFYTPVPVVLNTRVELISHIDQRVMMLRW